MQSSSIIKQWPYWLITMALMLGLTGYSLVQDGMFMDAVLYSTVAHHLSRGIGTFWHPYFSAARIGGLNTFHEQPPLAFGIQAVFYTLTGHSIWAERLYTLMCLLLSAALIAMLWRRLVSTETGVKTMAWWPLMLWITIPVCFWSYSNNMNENTMGIFTLLAVMVLYHGLTTGAQQWWTCAIAGLLVAAATLCKGVPGLFPLTVPIIYSLATRRITTARAIGITALIVLVLLAVYGILLSYAESRDSLSLYFFNRLLYRVQNDPTVSSRWAVLSDLIQNLLPMIVLCILVRWYALRQKTWCSPAIETEALLFLCIGLAGSAPLMLTKVQKAFYFVPALPYFAIAAAVYTAPVLEELLRKWQNLRWAKRIIPLTAILCMIASMIVVVSAAGGVSRDRDTLHDLYILGGRLPHGETIKVSGALWSDYEMQCYLQRHFDISYWDKEIPYRYYLHRVGEGDAPPEGFHIVALPLQKYELYQKNE